MYEMTDFYSQCQQADVDVIMMRAPAPGVTIRYGSNYCICLDFSQIPTRRLLRSVSCHEMSHVFSGSLHQVDSPFETQERAEYRANRYTATHYLTDHDFRAAFRAGCRELWELADYFDMDEQIIKNALSYWTERKGIDFNSYK